MFLAVTEKRSKKWKWLLSGVAIFCIVLSLAVIAVIFFEKKYENRIYPGIFLGEINLSGLKLETAKDIINEKVNNIGQDGIKFEYGNSYVLITPALASLEGDIAQELISFDSETTAEQAMAISRGGNIFSNFKDKYKNYLFEKKIPVIYDIKEEEIINILKENFNKHEIPAQNASLIATTTILSNGQEKIEFIIQEESLGKIIDYEKSLNQLKINLAQLDNSPIELFTKSDYPQIKKSECLNIEAEAEKIINQAPFSLTYDNQEWILDKLNLASYLALSKRGKSVNANLDKDKFGQFLLEEIAIQVDQEPVDARFEIENGKVKEFQASQDGLKLNVNQTIEQIEKIIFETKATSTELIVEEVKSKVAVSETNNLGIEEIIGTGHSNFSGSPTNRRHNIRTGASALNGLIIKPDEEFSLVEALGEVNAETGYLPEMVIKGNETIPEYGGGLCQIATTLFRTGIQSGLPITERRPHRYRVSYYEPAGTDAAVYGPHPDVRLINNTGNNILIQTRIDGNDIYFDFWGTKDGRVVRISDPVIYNITSPGPTKYIETLDLEPGKEKCTERSHYGADAYFDYKIIYANKEIKEERFSSHYVPWRAVCLIGVEKLSSDGDESETNEEQSTLEKATSTEE